MQAVTLDEIKKLGADVAKVTLDWRRVAPGGSRKPAGFVGDDPAQYSAARLGARTTRSCARPTCAACG